MEGGASNASSIISAVQTAFTSIASDATTLLTTIIPIALGIFALVWLARKAPGWFNTLTGRK